MARKVIGPTGSRRRRWLFLLCLVSAAAAAVIYIAAAGAVVSGSPSSFESADQPSANMTVEGSPATDWNCFANGGASNTSGFVTSGINTGAGTCAATSGATDITADSAAANAPLGLGAGEAEQTPGEKFDTGCPTFKIG